MTIVLVAGALVGMGLTVVVAGLQRPVPDLSAGVARMTGATRAVNPAASSGFTDRAIERTTASIVRWFNLEKHRADLALTQTTSARMAREKLAYAALGLAFPVMLSAVVGVAGMSPPLFVPVGLSVGLAALLSLMPEAELRRRAAVARFNMRRTVCAYLELVALERTADAGPVEALERAAAIGSGPGFVHIRQALLRARLEGRTPWHQLSSLADELDVAELGDVADIMRLSGEDGAAVLPTLRARAASLRTWLLQTEVTAANQASERMSIPVALLGVAFMALLGFPAFSRIVFG